MLTLRPLPQWPTPNHAEIVRRSRVLVIDDGDFPYLKLFKRDGYTLEQWTDVTDLTALENDKYDVILLDLRGVGAAESSKEGFGILEHIRKTAPAQIVVAYSNEDLSLEYQHFFRSADAVLHKTKTDYVEFKRTVDRLLDQRYSLGFYLDRIDVELSDQPAAAAKARRKAEIAIRRGNSRSLQSYMAKKVDDAVTVDRVLAIVGIAISAAGLWKG